MLICGSLRNIILVITGGTGGFDSTVLKHFLPSDVSKIRSISRNKKKQDMMRHIPSPRYVSAHPLKARRRSIRRALFCRE